MDINDFTQEMEKILFEKHQKYGETWKTDTLSILREKMDKQIKDISIIIMSGVDWDKEKVGRKLVHVANYALLSYMKLGMKLGE